MLRKHAVSTQLGLVFICKYTDGGLGHRQALNGLDADECHKQPMAYITVGPCGLGCQYLGPCHYTCGCKTSVRGRPTLGGITSYPDPLPCSPGEDDSPKPSWNRWRPWQGMRCHLCPPGWCRMGPAWLKNWKWQKVGFLVGLPVLAWYIKEGLG